VPARLAEGVSESRNGHWKLYRFPANPAANPLYHDWVGVIMFALLAFSLYYFARKPLATQEKDSK